VTRHNKCKVSGLVDINNTPARDSWRTVDWYGSIKRRTNVRALTGLMLGGLWTGMVRSNGEQTSAP